MTRGDLVGSRWPGRRLRSAVAAAVAVVLAVIGLSAAQPATAAPNHYAPSRGTLVGDPLTGPTNVAFNLKTSAACPAGTGVVNAFIDRPAAGWTEVLAIGGNTDPGSVTTGIPMGDTLTGIATTSGLVLGDGDYDLTLVCYPDAFGSPATAQFDGGFTIAGSTYTFTVKGKDATTTTLGVTPPNQAEQGDPVTLTATVAPGTAAGTVQFTDVQDGSTVTLGAPVAVSGGTAVLRTSELAAGRHTFRAVYAPAASAPFLGSTSAPVQLLVVGSGQLVTATALAVSPAGSAAAGTPVTFTATVTQVTPGTPAALAGSVTFLSSGATIGGPVAVADGRATFTTSLTAGSYSFAAAFTPTDPQAFTESLSESTPYTVTGGGGGGGGTLPPFLDELRVGVAARGSGTVTDPVTLAAPSPCPAGSTTVTTRLAGPGAWKAGADVIANGLPSTETGFNVEAESVASTAASAGLTVVPGAYRYEVRCLDVDGAVLGFYLGRLWFYDATHWLNQDPAKVGIPTHATLVVTPDARAVLGARVTLAATLDQPAAAGQIRFQTTDNSENVTVLATVKLANGKATWSTTRLGLGLYYLAAVYVPDGKAYNASTSPEVVFASTKIPPPLPRGAATVTGTPRVGRTLACNGSFLNATSLAYLWLRDGAAIGARTRTYRVAAADKGHGLSCRITASNAGGAVTRTSARVRVTA